MTYIIEYKFNTHDDFIVDMHEDEDERDHRIINKYNDYGCLITNNIAEAAEFLHTLSVSFLVTPLYNHVLRQLLDFVDKAENALFNFDKEEFCNYLGGRYEGSYISVRKV